MMTPMPTQLTGAAFLAARPTALLADEPRVGKTGAALLAARTFAGIEMGRKGLLFRVLIVTTSSGRAVWLRAVREWITGNQHIAFNIVSWDDVRQPKAYAALIDAEFNLAILDEDHRAKNPDTKTAQAVYGKFNQWGDRITKGLVTDIPRVWHLSGTPCPHDLGDMWCRLRSSAPHLLHNIGEMPDVTSYESFRNRYCVMRPKKLSNWTTIMVVIGGKNEAELKARIGDWMLRRTQKDVGIRPPVQELMPLIVSPAQRREIATDKQASEIMAAIESGMTRELEMDLGPLRRITGRIKAEAIVVAAKEWLEDNPGDKLVLAYYHREVGDILQESLGSVQCCRVDGSTSPRARELEQEMFAQRPPLRIFLAQIDAAGESIDLSAAAELWFVESTFSPKSMKQMAARISNVNQVKNTYIKVAFIENSIDDAIQSSLIRLWSSIKEVVA
jgi:SNF2 family DNA or RNA helicase